MNYELAWYNIIYCHGCECYVCYVYALQEMSDGKVLNKLSEHSNRVVACSVNMADQGVLSGSWDKTIIYWDLQTCKLLVSA